MTGKTAVISNGVTRHSTAYGPKRCIHSKLEQFPDQLNLLVTLWQMGGFVLGACLPSYIGITSGKHMFTLGMASAS
jgi:hypothetical protein